MEVKIIDGNAMIERVNGLFKKGAVDLTYYNIVKEAVQMEPPLKTIPKAQEPIEPIVEEEWVTPNNDVCDDIKLTTYRCPQCGNTVMPYHKYCCDCGQALKWND